jgi:hypothetical protein
MASPWLAYGGHGLHKCRTVAFQMYWLSWCGQPTRGSPHCCYAVTHYEIYGVADSDELFGGTYIL